MRHYQTNSPKAAARILALALLADGAIDPSELRTLGRYAILNRIGVCEEDFDTVIHELCEDLLLYAQRSPSGNLEVGAESLREVLGDISNPSLQHKLLRAVMQIVNADGHMSGGEAVLVSVAADRWALEPFDTFRTTPMRGRRWPPQVHPMSARATV